MLRKVLALSVLLVLSVGVAFAEQIRVVITKVDDGKVTYYLVTKNKKGEFGKGRKATLPVTEDVKVIEGKYNPTTKKFEGEPLEDGLKKAFADLPKNGRFADIITDSDNKKITEIHVAPPKKK